jgi:hypothetical protein
VRLKKGAGSLARLPMPMEKWFEELEALEALSRVKDQIALLAEQDLQRPSSQVRDPLCLDHRTPEQIE